MKTLHAILTCAAFLCAASACFGQGFVCAEGGGNPNKGSWSDEVFGWMIEKGKSGPVVIIGAVPIEDDDRPALFTRLGASKVTSLVIDQSNADSQTTFDAIAGASIVFIRGGDQSRYVNWWYNTATQRAIKAVFQKGGVIAGTSAGCAVLGEVTYDARHGGLAPLDILHDARHPDLTLTPDFLSFTPGVLYDTHFTERGRLPRLAVMLASTALDMKREIVGLGVDPRTAVCVSPDGVAEVRGEGTVTVLRILPDTVAELERGKPPVVRRVGYSQMPSGYRFDIKSWEVVARPSFVQHVRARAEAGRTYDPLKPITIDGGAKGTEPVQYLASVCAVSRAWSGEHIAGAMRAGQMWVCNDPGATAFYLDAGAKLVVDDRFQLLTGCTGDKDTSVVMLHGGTMTWAGISENEQPAIEGATLDVVPVCPAPAPNKPSEKPPENTARPGG